MTQGFEAHSLLLTSQFAPLHPGSQSHLYLWRRPRCSSGAAETCGPGLWAFPALTLSSSPGTEAAVPSDPQSFKVGQLHPPSPRRRPRFGYRAGLRRLPTTGCVALNTGLTLSVQTGAQGLCPPQRPHLDRVVPGAQRVSGASSRFLPTPHTLTPNGAQSPKTAPRQTPIVSPRWSPVFPTNHPCTGVPTTPSSSVIGSNSTK